MLFVDGVGIRQLFSIHFYKIIIMNFLIQSSVFPSHDLCSEESLYFRLNDRCLLQYGEHSRVLMQKGGRLHTDTYFNSVSIGKWKNHTGLTDLTLQLHFKGAAVLKWMWHRTQNRHAVIGEVNLSSDDAGQAVQVQVPQYERLVDGVVSFELFALEDSELLGFEYTTTMAPRREVKLGIAITHFNRQQYVIPAVRRLNQQLLTDPRYADRVKLFVVDNSQNLTADQMTGAQIIPNANLGGSGGFMRGLIHLQDSGEFTHCLFMDDDASNETESIRRSISFLQYATDENLAIVGTMFREQFPNIQYENNSWFNGVCHSRIHNLDMIPVENLVESEAVDGADFGGWWFFFFPLVAVKSLSFPYFVRGDDIGFSLANPFKIITLAGVNSWQEEFDLKNGVLPSYLDIRSLLILALIRSYPRAGRGKSMRIVRNFFKRLALTYQYESAEAVLDGVEDVLKGSDFWRNNVDMSQRRPEILARAKKEKLVAVAPDWFNQYQYVESHKKVSLRKKILLNGHLIPKFLFRKKNVAVKKGYGGCINETYRRREVLYIHELTQQGFVVQHDKVAFFRSVRRYLGLQYQLWRNYERLSQEYRESFSELTSREFWLKQFETHNK